jgi:hypothetical protein
VRHAAAHKLCKSGIFVGLLFAESGLCRWRGNAFQISLQFRSHAALDNGGDLLLYFSPFLGIAGAKLIQRRICFEPAQRFFVRVLLHQCLRCFYSR